MTFGRFGPSSRYAGLEIASRIGPDGSETRYVRRRFIPRTTPPAIGWHMVSEGDRIDLIAARTLGDPLLWWQIADANRALDPGELTAEIGRAVRIAIAGDVASSDADDQS